MTEKQEILAPYWRNRVRQLAKEMVDHKVSKTGCDWDQAYRDFCEWIKEKRGLDMDDLESMTYADAVTIITFLHATNMTMGVYHR